LIVGIWFFSTARGQASCLRAVGDNHTSAHALGYPVLKIRCSPSCSAAAAPALGARTFRSPTRRSGFRA
jgi:ABC-type uncharacterized transport system permease subunit